MCMYMHIDTYINMCIHIYIYIYIYIMYIYTYIYIFIYTYIYIHVSVITHIHFFHLYFHDLILINIILSYLGYFTIGGKLVSTLIRVILDTFLGILAGIIVLAILLSKNVVGSSEAAVMLAAVRCIYIYIYMY
jgi:hypothetical protein